MHAHVEGCASGVETPVCAIDITELANQLELGAKFGRLHVVTCDAKRGHVHAAARTAKQFLTFVNGGPFQHGIARGLALPTEFFTALSADMQAKRDRLLPGLVEAGFVVYPTSGTYFVTVDIRPLRADGDGMAFCRELPHRCGVVAIPNEVFYANKHEGRHLVRFAFCKRPEVLDEVVVRLKGLAA